MRYIRTILAITLLTTACKSKKEETLKPNTPPPASVDIIIASKQNISNFIEANGSVVANEYVDIHPEVSGRLTFLHVPDGAEISTGTILARINDAELQAQLNKSKVQ
jgi:membrane fusion protein (multidrug efflux system)